MKKGMAVLIVLLSGIYSVASARTINGIVTDFSAKVLVSGAKVSLDATHYTFTGVDGKFNLNTDFAATPLSKQKLTIAYYPAKGLFRWSGYSGEVSVKVTNMRGQVVARHSYAKSSAGVTFSVSSLPQGMYIVTIRADGRDNMYKVLNLRSIFAGSNLTVTQSTTISAARSSKPAIASQTVLTFEKSGYGLTTKCVAEGQNNIAVRMAPASPPSKLAKILSSDTEIIINQGAISFPLTRPGEKITVKKVLKGKRVVIESNSSLIQCADDLVRIERQESEAKIQKYGAMSNGLIEKIAKINSSDKIRVVVCLKIQPAGKMVDMDPKKYSEEAMKAMALKFLSRAPVVEKSTFINRHGIQEVTLQKGYLNDEYKNFPRLLLVDVDKNTLNSLSFDSDVAGVEEYAEPIPFMTTQPCPPLCKESGNELPCPCLSTYAFSAYNPDSLMPTDPDARGGGINAATFEGGLRDTFVTCFNDSRLLYYNQYQYNPSDPAYHCESTFKCMANAASSANLFHFMAGGFGYGVPLPWFSSFGIRTASCSMGKPNPRGPTDLEMVAADFLAYVYPFPVLCNPTGNDRYCKYPDWQCYNGLNVGNVAHANETHYILVDSSQHCWWEVGTQTANPLPIYGYPLSNVFDCSSCYYGNRGDRELPMIVAPGWTPNGYARTSDNCVYDNNGINIQCLTSGTSYSAPTANGIAACVIGSDWRMLYSPEVVRVVLLATAQNVDDLEWNNTQEWWNMWDGRDGAGVISGACAVEFARNHETVYENNSPVVHGITPKRIIYASDTSMMGMAYYIKIPDTIPAGKHLRIVLTWDSSPCDQPTQRNDLSDLEIITHGDSTWYTSGSWGSNVEIVDIPITDLTAGNFYWLYVCETVRRIHQCAIDNGWGLYYWALGWTWVNDHAS